MKRIVKYTLYIIPVFLVLIMSCGKEKGPFIITPIDPIDSISFKNDIQPIFDSNCTACHNETHYQLNLDESVSYEQLLNTGYAAPYVLPGTPEESLLYRRLIGDPSIMPQQGSLPQIEIDLILQWIKEGAANN